MKPYANKDGDSGVRFYEVTEEGILVQFRSGPPYLYAIEQIGRESFETMVRLAEEGRGLSTFINKNRAIHGAGKKLT